VALSCCWGVYCESRPPFVTTVKNLKERKAGISMRETPRTIRDVILIMRRLGVGYLWIMLCVSSWAQIQRPKLFLDLRDESLYHRGWTLQERILSPRVLICKKDQFAWGCQSETATESGLEMHDIGNMRLVVEQQNATPPAETELTNIWQCVVVEYSSRSLSRPSDKLLAIASLAKQFSTFARRSGQDYLVRLWESSLLDDLLWVHSHTDFGDKVSLSRPPRTEYRGPSWS
jgi:hypothetical protein